MDRRASRRVRSPRTSAVRPSARELRKRAAELVALPYARMLGVELASVGVERARLRLRHRTDNGNRNGTLHGGALASLIDLAGTVAAEVGSEGRAHPDASTIDLSIHFIAAAVDETVNAEAVVVRCGRALSFVTVEVTNDAGKAIARGLLAHRRGGRRSVLADEHGPPAPEFAPSRHSGSPFTRQLGVRVMHLAPGRATALLPDDPMVAGRDGRVHEGALTALVDCAGGGAAWSLYGNARPGRAATIGMHLGFDVTTRGEDVLADATVIWRCGDILVNAVAVRGRASSRMIASGSVTYRIAGPPA
jgi:uncharacterized protein (TIGR00369 family)